MSYSFTPQPHFFSSVLVFVMLVCITAAAFSVDHPQTAQMRSDPDMTGNYRGYIYLQMENDNKNKKVDAALIVMASGEDEYRAVLRFDWLPGDQPQASAESKTVELELHGKYGDHTLRLIGDFPLDFQFIHNRYTALDGDNNYRGHFVKVIHIDDDK